MRTKLLSLAATGVAGLVLGAGVGVAAQDRNDDAQPPATAQTDEFDSMDQMHAAMRDQMPAGLAAQCDEMHAAMPEGMRSMDPGSMGSMMGGDMGSMMGGDMGGAVSDQHSLHHK